VLFGQALQITLVVAALIGFFVLFGFMAIDMETATLFTVGFANRIPTGALLLVSLPGYFAVRIPSTTSMPD